MATAVAKVSQWLMETRTDNFPPKRSEREEAKETTGRPSVSLRISISCQRARLPKPVPRAFTMASFAANLPANLGTGSLHSRQ